MRKMLLFAFVLCAVTQVMFAQGNRLRGTVKDQASGEALQGATLRVDGVSGDHQADENGAFSIPVSGSGTFTLVVSSVGYETQRMTVRPGTSITVLLVQENVMDEVVVIGYGTTRRRDLTASVSSVGAKDLKDIPINSAEQALAGRLAGVQVTTAEGSPDANVKIRVRGGISITGDNSPLYVVDGVIVANALSMLSPQDIESIDVLKDASSTAIYGARGANGVVIITTKSGKPGVTAINYNGFLSMQRIQKKLDVMDPYEFVTYQYERSRNSTTNEQTFYDRFGAFEDLAQYQDAPFVDWQDHVFGDDGLTQTHNASVVGGSEKTQYNLSLTSNASDAIMVGSAYDRKLMNFRLSQKVSDRFKLSFDARYNSTTLTGRGTSTSGTSGHNFLRQAIRYTPFLSSATEFYEVNDDLIEETNANQLYLVNPLKMIESQYRKNYGRRFNIGGFAEFAFTKYLNIRSTFGYNYNSSLSNQYDDYLTTNSRQNGGGLPIAIVGTGSNYTWNNSNVLNFSNASFDGDFHEKNRIDFLVGQEIFESRGKSMSVTQRYFPAGTAPEKAFANLGLASPPTGLTQPAPSSSEGLENISSFFSRLNWNHRDRYLLTLSVRADGSSVFAPGKQWGYFPSGALAWNLSEEAFVKNLSPVLSNFKVRVSYGAAGNNRIGAFQYLTQFVAIGDGYALLEQLNSIYVPSGLANANLRWEANLSKNAGVDIAFLNNRFRLTADYYENDSHDLLMVMRIPSTSGYSAQVQNVGATSNKGWELQLGADIVRNKNFSWTADFNISANRNTIKSMGGQERFLQNSGYLSNTPDDFLVEVGRPVGVMYGYVNDGFYTVSDFDYDAVNNVYTLKDGVVNNAGVLGYDPQPGVAKFKDLNSDGLVDLDNDRTVIGVAQPKFFGGLNQQFSYRNFDLSIFLNFQYGNDILNYNKLEFTNGYTPYANLLATVNDRWRTINDAGEVVTDPAELTALNANAKFWRPITSGAAFMSQSWAVEDGSFVRINNVTLGYTLPQNTSRKIGMKTLRLYVTGNNLGTITRYSGFDPEADNRRNTTLTPGVDFSGYPRASMYVFGINVTF
ncbi:SusC/RagA family TonB-linked outer membrane protein [Parapedobacter sp. 2B3]|uniref:SusC/RagA family TonB-linked outer membrane protein n=1 Tax=Parapedobacter sp. 2B3 TaxID=3342381 RepID=UPI0035B5C51D